MARRGTTAGQRADLTQDELTKGIKKFEQIIGALEEFDVTSITGRGDPRLITLTASITNAIQKTYPKDSTQFRNTIDACHLDKAPMNIGRGTSLQEVRDGYRTGIDQAVALLKAAIDDMREDVEDQAARPAEAVEPPAEAIPSPGKLPKSVFVVHGHDDGPRESVARFLKSVDLEPIILHEQAGRSRTIIEKFEDHSNVEFAVVLLTPDDIGGTDESSLQPRARQNVILELGYFVGILGRKNVCALKKGDVEIPSDLFGVEYKNLDDGGAWKFELAREIKAAGIEVDMNKIT